MAVIPPSTLHPEGLKHGVRHCPGGDDPMPCLGEDYSEEVLFLEQGDIVEGEWPVFTAPFKCTVTALGIAPDAAITGAADPSMTLQFQNKGADGAGVDVMAEKAFVAGVNVAAFDYDDFGDVAHAALEAGDVISLQKINAVNEAGSPDLIVRVLYRKAA